MTTDELTDLVRRVASTDLGQWDRLRESFTVLRVALPRPYVPDGWIILNAPRPLLGNRTWEGEWGHGRHWAAIDPADVYAPQWLRKSLDLDGWAVEFVGQEDYDRHAAEVCAAHGWEIEDFDAPARRHSYFNAHGQLVVSMEQP